MKMDIKVDMKVDGAHAVDYTEPALHAHFNTSPFFLFTLTKQTKQSEAGRSLTICWVRLSRWFPGSRTCPRAVNRWRRERWCPPVLIGWTTCSPGCCRTPQGIRGWLWSPRCLLTYLRTLPPLMTHRRRTDTKASCVQAYQVKYTATWSHVLQFTNKISCLKQEGAYQNIFIKLVSITKKKSQHLS